MSIISLCTEYSKTPMSSRGDAVVQPLLEPVLPDPKVSRPGWSGRRTRYQE